MDEYTKDLLESPKFELCGETFAIQQEHEYFYITHPYWSLTSMGETLIEAYENLLLEEIPITYEFYEDEPDSELTEEARDFKYWLQKMNTYHKS